MLGCGVYSVRIDMSQDSSIVVSEREEKRNSSGWWVSYVKFKERKIEHRSLEILRDTGLLGIMRWVFNPGVPPRRNVTNDRLRWEFCGSTRHGPCTAETAVVWVSGAVLVVLVSIVAHADGAVARAVGSRTGAVLGRCVARAAAHVGVVARDSGAHGAEDFTVGGWGAAVHKRFARVRSVGDAAAAWGGGIGVGSAATARHGCRGFPCRGACEGRGAPASVARGTVLLHLVGVCAGDGWDGRVGVGVVTILLDFLSSLLFGILALLALPPQENARQNQKCNRCDRDHNSDCNFPAAAQASGGCTARVDGSWTRG